MKLSTKELILCALFAAIIAILSQISIPLPFTTVPLTMQIFAVAVTGLILGSRLSTISVLIYLLLGGIGIPVFAQFTGGVAILFGPTGGYLLGLPFMTYIIGLAKDKSSHPIVISLSLIAGLIGVYVAGTLMFAAITGNTIYQSILYCVAPFVLADFIKLILAYVVGSTVSKRISSNLVYSKTKLD